MLLLVTIYSFAYESWENATFTGGAIIAQLRLAQQEGLLTLPIAFQTTPKSLHRSPLNSLKRRMPDINVLGFFLSLYLLSVPDDETEKAPGYRLLARMTPPVYLSTREFWHPIGSLLLLWTVEQVSFVRRFLRSDISQYLGKISFGLYLVHRPLLHFVGYAIQPEIWHLWRSSSTTQWCFGLLLGWSIMLTLCIAAGHMFWLWVDESLVWATKKLEKLARSS